VEKRWRDAIYLICGIAMILGVLWAASSLITNAPIFWPETVAIVAFAISWLVTWERLEGERLAVVLDPAVEVLAGPGENNASLFTVHEGLTLTIRAERPDWVQVSLPNGLNGWIPRTALGFV